MKKKILWVLALAVFLGGLILVLIRHNLNQRLNSPMFQANMEREISKALEGKMTFSTLRGNVGFRPWVGLGAIKFVSDNGDFLASAKELRVAVKVLPLLRQAVVFSDVKLVDPSLRIRRRPDGSEPVLPNLKGDSNRKGEGFEFQVQHMLIHKATVDLVDESLPGFPSIKMRADISLTRREGGIEMKVLGQLGGERGNGTFHMEGRTGDGGQIRFDVSRIPMGLVSEFVPQASPWSGSFSIAGFISGPSDKRAWELKGQTEDLRLKSTDQRLPLQAEWTLQSGSSLTVRAVWTSTRTQVTANVLLPDFRVPSITVNLKGERLDLGEFTDLFLSLPSASSASVSGNTPWSVIARMDVNSILWNQWAVENVRLRAEAGPTKGRVSDFAFNVFKGTATAQGNWQRSNQKNKGWFLGGALETAGVDVSELAQVLGSTLAWRGQFSGKVQIKELPFHPEGPMDSLGLLHSIPLAEVIQASATATHVGVERWAFDETGVVLAQDRKKSAGTARWHGVQGVSSFTVAAQWPNFSGKSQEGTPLSVRADIDELDLEVLGTLFPRLGFRRGSGWVSGQWESVPRQKSPRDYLFGPSAQWGFRVKVSSADWKGVALTDLQGDLAWGSDGVFRFIDVGGQAAGGTLTLQGDVRGLSQGGPLDFSIKGKCENIETKEIVAALSTSAYLVKGRFSGDVNLQGPLQPWNPMELNGNVAFTGRDGEFLTAPTVLSVFSALKINALLRTLEGKKESGLPFDVIEASGPIQSGRYIMDQPLLLKNASFQVAYTGWMEVQFMNGRGTVLFNFLQGTSNLLNKIPVVSSLVLGQDGELIPLVVDIVFENGKTSVTPRSIKTLTGPLVSVVKNVFHLPFKLFSPKKKSNGE